MNKAITVLLVLSLTVAIAGTGINDASTRNTKVSVSSLPKFWEGDPSQNIWGRAPKISPITSPATDDSLWIKVDSVPLSTIGSYDAYLGIKVYGDTIYLMWNRYNLPWLLKKIDRVTGALLDTIHANTIGYALSAVRVDDSIYVTMFYPNEEIQVYGPNGNYVRSMYPPAGYMCRGMDWDGKKFWIADNTPYPNTVRIYTMTRNGTLLRTLNGTGTPAITWIMDLTIDKMIGNRIWLNDNVLNQACYVSFDTLANTFRTLATFDLPGNASEYAEGIGFFGPDLGGYGYVYVERHMSLWAWKMRVHSSFVISDTLIVPFRLVSPTLDGQIQPGEWDDALRWDISDIMGQWGTPYPAGTVIMFCKHDSFNVFWAVNLPTTTSRDAYDEISFCVDENYDRAWATDSSEGNHWLAIWENSRDTVVMQALPSGARFGGAGILVTSLASGHLQYEGAITKGTAKWNYNINPVCDTVGLFAYYIDYPAQEFWACWPTTFPDPNHNWNNPVYYGTMIFSPPVPSIAEATNLNGSYHHFHNIYPNPLRDFARIHFSLQNRALVELKIYDIMGKVIRTLISGWVEPGDHYINWDRTNNNGLRVANGSYFCQIRIDGKSVVSKAIILK